MINGFILLIFSLFFMIINQISNKIIKQRFPQDEIKAISNHIRIYGTIENKNIAQTGIACSFFDQELIEPLFNENLETIDSLEFYINNIIHNMNKTTQTTDKKNFFSIEGKIKYKNLLLDKTIIGYYSSFPAFNHLIILKAKIKEFNEHYISYPNINSQIEGYVF